MSAFVLSAIWTDPVAVIPEDDDEVDVTLVRTDSIRLTRRRRRCHEMNHGLHAHV